MIVLSSLVTATTADFLNSTLLQSAPSNGVMIIEVLSSLNDATNAFAITIQQPNGDVAVNAQSISGMNPTIAGGVLDNRQSDRYEFPIAAGGHMVITLTESGTAILQIRVTFVPTV